MSQGPWQTPGVDLTPGQQSGYIQAPRISALAVSSLVFSLVCCLPGTGAIAAALGGGALVSIGKSEGRLTGKPLAIVGLVLGMLFSTVWIFGAIGVSSVWNTVRTGIAPALTAFETGDTEKIKKLMMQDVRPSVGDEQVMRFSAEIKAKLGRPEGLPSNLIDVVQFYINTGSNIPPKYLAQMQGGRSQVLFMPLPVQFTNGRATVLLQMPANGQTSARNGEFSGILRNVIIILADGTELKLLPDDAAAETSAKPAPGNAPEEGAAPAGEPAKKKPGF